MAKNILIYALHYEGAINKNSLGASVAGGGQALPQCPHPFLKEKLI
ncbi:MAG TPA: hypothetical protein VES65_00870 [Solirubrobacteraceae bacterium]|nr:hypothetical protein [Solirubrobacteraceae bacterium]